MMNQAVGNAPYILNIVINNFLWEWLSVISGQLGNHTQTIGLDRSEMSSHHECQTTSPVSGHGHLTPGR